MRGFNYNFKAYMGGEKKIGRPGLRLGLAGAPWLWHKAGRGVVERGRRGEEVSDPSLSLLKIPRRPAGMS